MTLDMCFKQDIKKCRDSDACKETRQKFMRICSIHGEVAKISKNMQKISEEKSMDMNFDSFHQIASSIDALSRMASDTATTIHDGLSVFRHTFSLKGQAAPLLKTHLEKIQDDGC